MDVVFDEQTSDHGHRLGIPRLTRRATLARLLVVLPVALAIAASVVVARMVWTATFLAFGAIVAAAIYDGLGSYENCEEQRPQSLYSWSEVDRDLERAFRRAQARGLRRNFSAFVGRIHLRSQPRTDG